MQFLESICFHSGIFHLLEYHQQRINHTFKDFYPEANPINLKEVLPNIQTNHKQKVRLLYSDKTHEIEIEDYQVKPVHSLRLIINDQIDYSFKLANREQLRSLYNQRNEADDILIIKDGMVTDSYYANAVFWNGSRWLTPYSHLLNGIKRQYLLERGEIAEEEIRVGDIFRFEKMGLINAMLDIGDVEIPIHKQSVYQ